MTAPERSRARLLAETLAVDPLAAEPDLAERLRRSDPLLPTADVSGTVVRALARARGLGALDPFLQDPTVTEIMINGPGPVWLDRGGQVMVAGRVDRDEVELLVERILQPLGLRVDRTSPFVDARLDDGSRVNIVVPPLAVDGPVVTIRRFAARLVDLAEFGPADVVALLAERVAERDTILVVGGTAAGKTTLLNALSGLLDPRERIVTIEDTAELRLPGDHVVRLEARPANSEGIGAVGLRDLVRNALRMRPDRLVVGEVRGPEALDLILALSAGHDGSLATCHAASCAGGLGRLATLAMLGAADVSAAAIRSQLAEAVDLVVRVAKVGGRREVAEVAALRSSGADLDLELLWSVGSRVPL